MSEPGKSPGNAEHLESPESPLFRLLDAYSESLRNPDFDAGALDPSPDLIDRHPELGELLNALDALHDLSESVHLEGSPPATNPKLHDATIMYSPKDSRARQRKEEKSSDGLSIGPYTVLQEIGRGGMGVVYKAQHSSLKSVIALKVIRSSELASGDEVERFLQEARTAAGVSHSNIIKVHDFGEWQGLHYLTMDLVQGPNLAQMLRSQSVSQERAAQIVADVARAVHHLHMHGIIHRDLKPSNILFDSTQRPFVTDFGLVKWISQPTVSTVTGAIIGTPSYMAPEQAAPQNGVISARSDIYSLGAILYELLTGRPPFQAENPLDTLLYVLESDPVPPRTLNKGVSRDLQQICLRCLEKNPDRRYQSAQELADDLDRFIRQEPLALPPVSVGHRVWKWLRREPALVLRFLGLAIATIIVQTYAFVDQVEWREHGPVLGALGLWAAVSWILQMLLNRDPGSHVVRYLWGAADAILYTFVLYQSDPPLGPLYVGYPMLVAASGLWFRVRLVWFMTGICIASLVTLSWIRPDEVTKWHYPLIVGMVIAVVGGIIAYQVHRIRVLTRYDESHRSSTLNRHD